MGAGKSTVGRLLAPLLGWRFLDADQVLTSRTGLSIAQLFWLHGEPAFREMEAALVAELLREENTVLALGGGAVEHPDTQSLLRTMLSADSESLLVYLEAPLAVSLARCAAEPGAAVRPVLSDQDLLRRRFATRLPLYRSAHLVMPTVACSPDEIARQIADQVAR